MSLSVVNLAAELSIRADARELRRASAWLKRTCLEHSVPLEEISRIELCLNEALANIITHNGTNALLLPISLHLDICTNQIPKAVTLIVSDSGAAFDPLAVPLKPRPKTLAEAEPGGLGLLMIQNLADNVSYQYSDGRNQLTFSVYWKEDK